MSGASSLRAAKSRRTAFFSEAKLVLLWCHRFPPFSPLSANVLREVSAYLSFPASPVCLFSESLCRYEPSTQRWRLLCRLKQESIVLGCACIGVDRAFLETVQSQRKKAVSRCVLVDRGRCFPLPKLTGARKDYGLTYDAREDAVYLFGGCYMTDNRFEEASQVSESIFVGRKEWKRLPLMSEKRSRFTPCWYETSVFLVSGECSTLEIYDPQRNRMSLVPHFSSPIAQELDTFAISFVQGQEFVVMTEGRTLRWRPGDRAKATPSQALYIEVKSPPVRFGEWLFLADESSVTAVDLTTGHTHAVAVPTPQEVSKAVVPRR